MKATATCMADQHRPRKIKETTICVQQSLLGSHVHLRKNKHDGEKKQARNCNRKRKEKNNLRSASPIGLAGPSSR
jgi:hypothetical protein